MSQPPKAASGSTLMLGEHQERDRRGGEETTDGARRPQHPGEVDRDARPDQILADQDRPRPDRHQRHRGGPVEVRHLWVAGMGPRHRRMAEPLHRHGDQQDHQQDGGHHPHDTGEHVQTRRVNRQRRACGRHDARAHHRREPVGPEILESRRFGRHGWSLNTLRRAVAVMLRCRSANAKERASHAGQYVRATQRSGCRQPGRGMRAEPRDAARGGLPSAVDEPNALRARPSHGAGRGAAGSRRHRGRHRRRPHPEPAPDADGATRADRQPGLARPVDSRPRHDAPGRHRGHVGHSVGQAGAQTQRVPRWSPAAPGG